MMRYRWSPAMTDLLIELYPNLPTEWIAHVFGLTVRQIYQKAAHLSLTKSEAYLASAFACRMRRGDNIGTGTRFRKGQQSWNKGKAHPTRGRSAETQFKPGIRQGVAIKLYKPIGSERISKDGYLERKVNDAPPPQKRWRAVHLLIWEAANGPLPAGHALVFRDGDKSNIELDNLELITRADLMRRNSVHNYGPDIASIYQLQGAIQRQINKRLGKSL